MSLEPLRLLLVHGSAAWPQPLLQQLQTQGLQLACCRRPEEAQQRLLQVHTPAAIDLVVVDLGIGVMAWQRFGDWMQSHKLSQPILVVGSQLDEVSRVQLLESWADAVVPQPFSIPEFVARCRALWRRQQMRLAQQQSLHPNTCLQHLGLEMRVEEHRVWRGGHEVELTPREFRLLEFLLRHPGQVFAREALMEQVWGEYSFYELDPKTVDVHIRWLRLKLERDPAAPVLITTVRGRGYRLG